MAKNARGFIPPAVIFAARMVDEHDGIIGSKETSVGQLPLAILVELADGVKRNQATPDAAHPLILPWVAAHAVPGKVPQVDGLGLGPCTAEQIVDERRYISDIDTAVLVGVGCVEVDR